MSASAGVGRPRRWPLLVALAAGAALLVLLVRFAPEPAQAPPAEQARVVRVIEAPVTTVVPRAWGHGSVRPGNVWQAVAQVGGQVLETHPRLERGAIVEANDVLVRIDPTDYRLALERTETDIAATEARLAELEVEADNTHALLELEREALTLAERELERRRRLAEQGSLSRSDLEAQLQATLAERESVRRLENTLALVPARRRVLEAELDRFRAQLEQARLDLERTVVRVPFDARIAEVNVEITQYVREGEVMAVADGMAVAEIEAQVPIGSMRQIIPVREPLSIALAAERLPEILALEARVYLRDIPAEWAARFARMSDTIDPRSRTIGVIVEVDEPYRKARPGVRPPLVKGMFVEVELEGPPREGALVVPRAALHEGRLYVVGEGERLVVREVEVDLVQPELVGIAGGLEPGERVVLSDLAPAIEGMLLEAVADDDALARLLAAARGEAP